MTENPRQLPVVDVDQAFPLLTTDGAGRGGSAAPSGGDQGPAVAVALRDVLGWRPRGKDPRAFNSALAAAFELRTVEGHVEATHVQRGIAVQADLGGITGGQASLYARAKSSHEQITRMLDGIKPLRPDADPEDCEAFRALIRDAVRQIVQELGMPGGPRVQLVNSAFRTLTGYEPPPSPALASPDGSSDASELATSENNGYPPKAPPAATPALTGQTADDVPGTLGALRDRMGLTDDNVNTVDEEKIRTSFLTLVDLVVDLQRSWDNQRVAFGRDAGRGFLGTEMILISRLLAAGAEQVDELERVLDSAMISAAERQTVVIDADTRLTLDGLLAWMRTFLTEDGPRIIQDTGRDGITTSFTPTAVTLLQTLRDTVVSRLPVSTGDFKLAPISLLPVGCCTRLPAGMFAARTRIAVSGLCSLLEQLVRTASRIGRFSGVILFDLVVTPYLKTGRSPQPDRPEFLRVEVRGLHLRPGYLPAFVREGTRGERTADLVLPIEGSASGDSDSMVGVFRGADINAIAHPFEQRDFRDLFDDSAWTVPASAVPLAVFDSETGRVVVAPRVRTWPFLTSASDGLRLDLPTSIGDTAQTSFGVFAVPPDDPDDDCGCEEPEPERSGSNSRWTSTDDTSSRAVDERLTEHARRMDGLFQSLTAAMEARFERLEEAHRRLVDRIQPPPEDRQSAADQGGH